MAGACCPGPGEPEKPDAGDAGDAGPQVDAGPDAGPGLCSECSGGFEFSVLCDGGACEPPACDAGGGLAVFTNAQGHRLFCGRPFDFEIEAECGEPPYVWSLILDGGFPPFSLSQTGNVADLQGEISACDVPPAVIDVRDIAGHHATATLSFQ
jgi:hypothetical protein